MEYRGPEDDPEFMRQIRTKFEATEVWNHAHANALVHVTMPVSCALDWLNIEIGYSQSQRAHAILLLCIGVIFASIAMSTEHWMLLAATAACLLAARTTWKVNTGRVHRLKRTKDFIPAEYR